MRNVFIEGSDDKYYKARELIDAIVNEHNKTINISQFMGESNPNPGPYTNIPIPDEMMAIVAGKLLM